MATEQKEPWWMRDSADFKDDEICSISGTQEKRTHPRRGDRNWRDGRTESGDMM